MGVNQRVKLLACLPLVMLMLTGLHSQAQETPSVIAAADFGATGDGVTDDGPAVARMIEAARSVEAPVHIQFESNKTYFIKTSPLRYVFPLHAVTDFTLDGAGSTFLLAPHLRFLDLADSTRVTLRRLNVDFSPLPFVDGTVVGVDPEIRCLDVRLDHGATVVEGGPTGEDGEQAFFAMLWHDGPYGPVSRHYWTAKIEAGDEPGLARVHAQDSFQGFGGIEPGKWRISIPVPGIAHRFGPGPCFRITRNETVTVEDVELWSAPWFGFEVTLNRGNVSFRRVNIRPKPESGRLTSLWRDGFHVKGNSAALLWEDCVLSGMNDDAFNISTHSSAVLRVISPLEIEVRQKFPLLPIPWQAGATLIAADEQARRLLGSARVTRAVPGPQPAQIQNMPAAPTWRLTLEREITGLGAGTMVWDPGQCNPHTTLRRCTIQASCRMQSPVHLENCGVTALLWFYAEPVEGAFPGGVTIRNCVLRRGRGNPTLALVFSGGPTGDAAGPDAQAPPRAIHDVLLEGNRIWGSAQVEGVEGLKILANQFLEPRATTALAGNYDCEIFGNTGPAGLPYLAPPDPD